MILRSKRLFVSLIALGTTVAVGAQDEAAPQDLPGWGRVVDPSGDSEVTLEAEGARLKIAVPGTPHVLSVEELDLPMNAPRVLRRVRGDFTAAVRVLGRLEPGRMKTTKYAPYHGAGLIVWQDSSNYLRLERAVGFYDGRPHPYLNWELREEGQLAVTHGITSEDQPLYLKLRREGQLFSGWYSRDGRRWVELPRIQANLGERVQVGVIAVNSSARPLPAELEQFSVVDPEGSTARDYPDDDSKPRVPPPPSGDAPPVPPPPKPHPPAPAPDEDRSEGR